MLRAVVEVVDLASVLLLDGLEPRFSQSLSLALFVFDCSLLRFLLGVLLLYAGLGLAEDGICRVLECIKFREP